MTDQGHFGIGWYIPETVTTALPYGIPNGGAACPAIASNVADFTYNTGYLSGGPSNLPTTLTYNLMYVAKVGTQYWGGAVGDTEYFIFGFGTGLRFKLSDTTGGAEKWKIDVTNNAGTSVGTGTTEYACASSANVNSISVLRESTRVRVWVNSVLEVDASGISSTSATNNSLGQVGPQATYAGKHMYIGQILRASTDVADRYLDPTGFASAKVKGDGDGTDETARWTVYPAATNRWDDIKDWDSGVTDDGDGATTGTTIQSGSADATTYRSSYTTPTPSVANPLVVVHYLRSRVTVASKTPKIWNMIRDGSNRSEVNTFNPITTAYGTAACAYPNNPSGTGWDATALAALELGVRIDVSGGINSCLCSAIEAEVFGCTFASAAAAVTRRRTGATLMSPGVF